MALVAMSADSTKTRLAIRDYDDPRTELHGCALVCQACGYQMYIKGGTDNVRFHFAHYPNYPTSCPYYAHERMGDSKHEAGKFAVMAYLQRFADYAGCTMLDEVAISSRIADVMVTYPDGTREIHEVQLSAIQPDDLLERTRDYNRAGVDTVVWWLGGPMEAKGDIGLLRGYFTGTHTLIEHVDWPMLLNKRHLWPDEVERLKYLGAAYKWPTISMERKELNGAEQQHYALVFENGEYHARNS